MKLAKPKSSQATRWSSALSLASSFICLVATAHVGASEYQTLLTPDADGQWEIECICVKPNPTALQCSGLKVLDLAADSPRHTWLQIVAGQKGKAIDLSAACHRKRDVAALGDGMCCEAASEQDTTRLFAARVLGPAKKP